MLARVRTAALVGVDARLVHVEADVGTGLPGLHLVGLAETAVRESLERVRAALRNGGFDLPKTRTAINLAPADLKKAGSGYDLAIAIALLVATGQLPHAAVEGTLAVGELSLAGRLRPTRGVLAIASHARASRLRRIAVPSVNAAEAALVDPALVVHAETLVDLVDVLRGAKASKPILLSAAHAKRDGDPDLSDVRGQPGARRALEIAAAGNHNVLLVGPPGSGKTMLATRLPGILPPPSRREQLETTRIHSVAGTLGGRALLVRRPFRAPHHTISAAGLAGGGTLPRPGEISLAHNGVLFLDETPEFRRSVLETLRQPLESGYVTISRANATLTFPARILLVSAMNPCPCGWVGDPRRACRCGDPAARRYLDRLSGPLLDRIDLQVEVPTVPVAELARAERGEPSDVVRERVVAARRRAEERLAPLGHHTNDAVPAQLLDAACAMENDAARLLLKAIDRRGLSARTWTRLRRVARTIADLAGHDRITRADISEALQYDALDRRLAES